MDKQARELGALRVVYGPQDVASATHADKPDFVMAQAGDTAFGVEITDLYQSESNARLMNIPGYMQRLWAGERHVHGADVEELKVATVEITDKDGNVKQRNVPVIMQTTPPRELKNQLLAAVIAEKARKSTHYQDDLDWINLIIMDHFRTGTNPADGYNTADLLDHGVREALAASPFREVFLISQDSDGKFGYRPLRVLAMMESFYAMGEMCDKLALTDILECEDVAPLFVHAMRRYGVPAYLASVNGIPQAYVGSCAMHLTEESSQVFMTSDLPAPDELPPVDSPVTSEQVTAIVAGMRELLTTHGLHTAFVGASKHAEPFGPPEDPDHQDVRVTEIPRHDRDQTIDG